MSLSRAYFLLGAVLLTGCGSEDTESVNIDGEPATWIRRTGRSSDNEPVALAPLAEGGVVMAGRYYGEIDFGGGKLQSPNENYQAFVAKYDRKGQHVYSKSFGGDFAEGATDVSTLADGSVIVTGTFNWPVDFGLGVLSPVGNDLFVLKLDPDGKLVWSQMFGGDGNQRPTAMTATADGGCIVVGNSSGKFAIGTADAVDTSSGSFVLRLDSNGEPQWFDVVDGSGPVTIHDVAVAPNGTIAIGGAFTDAFTMGDLPELASHAAQDGFWAVYDDTGKVLRNKAVGGDGYSDSINALVFRPTDGNLLLTGQVEGPVDLGGGLITNVDMYDSNTYVLAVNTAGEYVNSRLYGRSGSDGAYGLAVDDDGNAYVAGEFYGSIAFGPISLASKGNSDAFVGKIRPNLEPAFQQAWGDSERQTAYSVAVDGNGRVYVAGSVYGTVDFGLGPTTGSGYYDTFLVALPR
ncbi:MAG TPA: SBBP repeat-containing protein [Polyangium sp.]|nr:SBBP repeat-containing protein [Polyangium sp.]